MDIDECSTLTHSCHPDSDCTNTMGSYDCECKDGFTGDGLICYDIDECKVANLDCHFDAQVSVHIGSQNDLLLAEVLQVDLIMMNIFEVCQ